MRGKTCLLSFPSLSSLKIAHREWGDKGRRDSSSSSLGGTALQDGGKRRRNSPPPSSTQIPPSIHLSLLSRYLLGQPPAKEGREIDNYPPSLQRKHVCDKEKKGIIFSPFFSKEGTSLTRFFFLASTGNIRHEFICRYFCLCAMEQNRNVSVLKVICLTC